MPQLTRSPMRMIARLQSFAAVAFFAGLVGCGAWDAPDQNGLTLESLSSSHPSLAAVSTATQALLIGIRNNSTFENVLQMGMFGHEGYDLDPSNPQVVTQTYVTGGDLNYAWTPSYQSDKQANVVLTALNVVTGMTDQEKEASRGFVKTMKALDLLYVIETSDESGAVLDVPDDPTAAPSPIATKAQTYARILQLLDEAAVHLGNGGDHFAFQMSPGFADFADPGSFLKFNRGIRARVDVYLSNYAQALTDLAASFLDLTQPLASGAYHSFSTNSGDATNFMYDPSARQLFAPTTLETDAQLRADGSPDLRFTTKTRPITEFSRYGFDVKFTFTIYNSPSAPIPVQKNEELVLLRAEANLGLGNAAAALTDINVVRVNSGGLDPLSGATWAGYTSDQQLEELLYEKRYSLLWEGGFRWLDLRHYGKLTELPREQAGFLIYPYTRLPVLECNPRTPQPAGCAQPAGL